MNRSVKIRRSHLIYAFENLISLCVFSEGLLSFRFPTMTNIELTQHRPEGVPPPDGQTNGGTLNKAYDKAEVCNKRMF